ncbi:MAG: hemerythrin domain-containing protein [Caulobacterales bacterium]
MTAVIEALRRDHQNIARLLEALEHQINIFADAGDPDYDVICGIADYFLDFPDRCHHPKEDAIFAQLLEAHPADASAIGDLPGEHRLVHERAVHFHETVSALLNDTDIARSTIVDAARQFIDLERRHMQREEIQFLPLAARRLTPADWTRIEAKLASGQDPLFGEKIEEQFRKLSQRLIAWEQESVQAR